MGADAVDEVGRHRLPEPVAAHDHRHLRARVGQVHHGLARGVAGAHHDDRQAAALRRLAAPGAVVDAAAEQRLDALDVQPAPDHARGDERDPRLDLVAAAQRERERPVGPAAPAALDAAQHHELGAEALRLAAREPAQLGAADAVGEAEEVLDHRRVRGLAARHVLLDHEGGEPVRGGVDGGREPGGPAAHDREVVGRAPRRRADVPQLRDALHRRRGDHQPVVDQHRQLRPLRAARREQRLRLRGPGVEPRVGLGAAREEVAQAMVLGVQAPPDDGDVGAGRAHAGFRRNISSSS